MFKRYWWMLSVMAPVGMMVGLMLAAVVTYVMPKKYESYAMIEIKPQLTGGMPNAPMNPNYYLTEMEKIKSRNSLLKVVDSLELINKWGVDHETAIGVLRQIVKIRNIQGTDLFQIHVRHTNKADARDIAVEVVKSYKDYSHELVSEGIEKAISELRKAVRDQEDRVEERRKILTIITRNKGEGGGADSVDKQNFVDATREYEMEISLLEQLKLKLITEEITQNLPNQTVVVHDDPVIADSPISPNVTLNLVAGAVGGVLISPFLALPLMWWMSRRKTVDRVESSHA